MTVDTLPLFSRPRSPFGHLPIAAHIPDESLDDFAARIVSAGGPNCQADEHTLEMVAAWRQRRELGDTAPKPGCWGEYRLTLRDGTPITAEVKWPYMPGSETMQHVAFYGDISPTGYRSQFFDPREVDREFGEWIVLQAEKHRAETIREWEKQQRKAAPKKRPARK